jgi:hypothetical protein
MRVARHWADRTGSPRTEVMMRQDGDILGPSQLNYEAWRDLLRSKCGRYYSKGIEPAAFTGWVRPVSARGFTATDIGCNSHQSRCSSRRCRSLLCGPFGPRPVGNDPQRSSRTPGCRRRRIRRCGAPRYVSRRQPGSCLQHPISQLTAPIAGCSSWIRTAGWALPARRDACRAPTLRTHSRFR